VEELELVVEVLELVVELLLVELELVCLLQASKRKMVKVSRVENKAFLLMRLNIKTTKD
jgi:hypothetical protein